MHRQLLAHSKDGEEPSSPPQPFLHTATLPGHLGRWGAALFPRPEMVGHWVWSRGAGLRQRGWGSLQVKPPRDPQRQTPDVTERVSLPQNVPERDRLACVHPCTPPPHTHTRYHHLSLAGPGGKRWPQEARPHPAPGPGSSPGGHRSGAMRGGELCFCHGVEGSRWACWGSISLSCV